RHAYHDFGLQRPRRRRNLGKCRGEGGFAGTVRFGQVGERNRVGLIVLIGVALVVEAEHIAGEAWQLGHLRDVDFAVEREAPGRRGIRGGARPREILWPRERRAVGRGGGMGGWGGG